MDRDQYWAIVEKARPKNNDPERHCEALVRRLRRLPPAEIIDFDRHHSRLVDDAYRADLWSAAYEINGGCSDDGFTYFRWWLAAQGRDVYELALADPESLAEIHAATEELEWEDFGYLAMEAYRDKTGEEDIPYDYHSERHLSGRPKLRGRFIKTERGVRRKWPMLWRLLTNPPAIDPAWLKWNDGVVKLMARSIQEGHNWAELPILADALQDAGCEDGFILDHLRAGKPHARSCWVSYLLLRKRSAR